MLNLDALAATTLVSFIAGLVYSAGRLTQRVVALEQWRHEVRDELRDIKDGIEDVKKMIRGEAT